MKENRIEKLFQSKKNNIVSIFFTAGFPKKNDTSLIIQELVSNGVDLIEVGMPFSDPIADGLTIQNSSKVAIENGMTVSLLLEQLRNIRKFTNVPLILMGYLNPIIRYGESCFFKEISEIGIDGLIIPDLPFDYYLKKMKPLYLKYNIVYIGLITPTTTQERIRAIDSDGPGFIYTVSSHGITGDNLCENSQEDYYKKIQDYKLKTPFLIGFGIRNSNSIKVANQYSNGVIVGSAFIESLIKSNSIQENVKKFINSIKV